MMLVGQAAREEIQRKYPKAVMMTIVNGVAVMADGIAVGAVSYEDPDKVIWSDKNGDKN